MNEIIKAANFPMQPNKSQTLAGKSLLLFCSRVKMELNLQIRM